MSIFKQAYFPMYSGYGYGGIPMPPPYGGYGGIPMPPPYGGYGYDNPPYPEEPTYTDPYSPEGMQAEKARNSTRMYQTPTGEIAELYAGHPMWNKVPRGWKPFEGQVPTPDMVAERQRSQNSDALGQRQNAAFLNANAARYPVRNPEAIYGNATSDYNTVSNPNYQPVPGNPNIPEGLARNAAIQRADNMPVQTGGATETVGAPPPRNYTPSYARPREIVERVGDDINYAGRQINKAIGHVGGELSNSSIGNVGKEFAGGIRTAFNNAVREERSRKPAEPTFEPPRPLHEEDQGSPEPQGFSSGNRFRPRY